METSSPPLTPIRNYVSPFETPPASSYREQLRRRTSSFSSSHDLSPVTPRRNRFSNASQLSHDLPTPGEEGAGGLGNLADELDQLDDEEEYDGDTIEASLDRQIEGDKEPRDSGIDVTYSSRKGSPLVRNFSRPLGTGGKPPDEDEEEQEEKLSPDLEDAMHSIARMVSYTSTSEDPLIPQTVALLQDLGKQAGLEAGAQRLTTSTNSMAAYLTAQGKSLQALSTSLYSPFAAYASPLDPEAVDEVIPLIDALLRDLPLPDPAPLQGMQKLDRETTNVIHTLSQLADTLQMGKQITNSAARHLRTTQNMVMELRRERERADLARHELAKGNVHERLRERRSAAQCSEVLAGFEDVCEALRASLEQDAG
ncbi:hypothetical protein B0A54_05543 [Friedmanniomyces endolithicus]|uniref:Uncharacterized protein n=1 Tax=Friedmanniomyces endolithicus TaxID=329885 RepID=A0A4U0V542_9PEZI|nr:hypothetical protein B0A54_05543 [Friedmanniomyces endolithicus]